MANNVYAATALIGGAAGALDAIDGAGLADKDVALVAVQGDQIYQYVLDADSATAEASPDIIAPDANGGDKRWVLHRSIGSHRQLVILSADVVNNNVTANTLQDCTGMAFPVTAGVMTRFHFHICFTSASTSTGARWLLNGPASPTNFACSYQHPTAATTNTISNAIDFITPSSSASSSMAQGVVVIDGFVKPLSSGTMQLQFASEVSNSAITVLAGSTIEYW